MGGHDQIFGQEVMHSKPVTTRRHRFYAEDLASCVREVVGAVMGDISCAIRAFLLYGNATRCGGEATNTKISDPARFRLNSCPPIYKSYTLQQDDNDDNGDVFSQALLPGAAGPIGGGRARLPIAEQQLGTNAFRHLQADQHALLSQHAYDRRSSAR